MSEDSQPVSVSVPEARLPATEACGQGPSSPEAVPSPDSEAFTRVSDQLSVLLQKMIFCEQAIAKRLKDDFVKEKAFNALYEEMKQYKENFLFENQKPMFRSLMLLFDDMLRVGRSTQGKNAKKGVQTLCDELAEIFARNEIEILDKTPAKLDSQFQQAIKAEPTAHASEDMDVVQVVRCGFRRKQAVLRFQEVVVKRYQAAS